jgi:hypothetical protein
MILSRAALSFSKPAHGRNLFDGMIDHYRRIAKPIRLLDQQYDLLVCFPRFGFASIFDGAG